MVSSGAVFFVCRNEDIKHIRLLDSTSLTAADGMLSSFGVDPHKHKITGPSPAIKCLIPVSHKNGFQYVLLSKMPPWPMLYHGIILSQPLAPHSESQAQQVWPGRPVHLRTLPASFHRTFDPRSAAGCGAVEAKKNEGHDMP